MTADPLVRAPAPTRRTVVRPRRPVDLRLSLGVLRRGRPDPTMRIEGHSVWRATRTPLGPVTVHVRPAPDGALAVDCWGPGAEWAVERAPDLVGASDDTVFAPAHPLLAGLARRFAGLRMVRTEAVLEAVTASVLEQRVQGIVAWRCYARLVRATGEPAPGAAGLLLPPSPAALLGSPAWVYHRAGIERSRSDTLRRCGALAARIEETVSMPAGEAQRRLRSIPGIGGWTAAEAALIALGDADAVSVGDYHLPHVVSWALAGRPRGTDEQMLELLEPYRGQRGRVLRLLLAGGPRPPRYGPRLPIRDIAGM